MHYATHRHTAAELIVERADAQKEHMGLTSWENAPDGKIVKSDVSIAKNYLTEKELSFLERIVSANNPKFSLSGFIHVIFVTCAFGKELPNL